MNILYYFKDYESYMSKWQYIHIIDELEHYGHSVEVFNPLSFSSIEESNENLRNFFRKTNKKFDLFLNCESDSFLFSDTVQQIKSIGIPTALICFDNFHAPFIHKKIATCFDLVWLTSVETKWLFESWGCANIIVQPYAANPFAFKPNWTHARNAVSFIGTPYGSRTEILNLLSKNDIVCDVYSDKIVENKEVKSVIPNPKVSLYRQISQFLSFDIGRKVFYSELINKVSKTKQTLDTRDNLHIYPSVSFDEMQRIYSNSALSLNITVLRNTYLLKNTLHKLHLRTFEIPMCGGLEIATYTDELADYFENDKEIVLYKSEEEFISKSKYYLRPKNQHLVLEMKQNARKRAENEHTWIKRFNALFQSLGI